MNEERTGRTNEFTGQKDSEGNILTSNPETSGRYHSAWL
jgi:adenine-specific DNA-methyltransferase